MTKKTKYLFHSFMSTFEKSFYSFYVCRDKVFSTVCTSIFCLFGHLLVSNVPFRGGIRDINGERQR